MNQSLFVRKIIHGKIIPYLCCKVYAIGFMPKAGSILFSPSLNLIYIHKAAKLSKAFAKGINKEGK